jgi:hypothetical protein
VGSDWAPMVAVAVAVIAAVAARAVEVPTERRNILNPLAYAASVIGTHVDQGRHCTVEEAVAEGATVATFLRSSDT